MRGKFLDAATRQRYDGNVRRVTGNVMWLDDQE